MLGRSTSSSSSKSPCCLVYCRIFILCLYLSYQKEAIDVSDNYPGISFMELYSLCRAEFLVASDLGLRAQLKEFLDHKLLKMKKIIHKLMEIPRVSNYLNNI